MIKLGHSAFGALTLYGRSANYGNRLARETFSEIPYLVIRIMLHISVRITCGCSVEVISAWKLNFLD